MEAKQGSEDDLRQFLLSRIEEKGPLPFSDFMAFCLYHPEYGYYRSKETTIGKAGDYYTAPSVHPLFGRTISKQLFQMSTILGGNTFDVVEMGSGRGFLCKDILDWARSSCPSFFQHVRYHLIETAPHLLREQKERLREYERLEKVFWHNLEEFERGQIQIEGCFLSNELVDAFPVHRVVLDQGLLKELFVIQNNKNFGEHWGMPCDPRISDYFPSMHVGLEEGQKAEINLKALEWIEHVGRSLKRGFVLTIDYGYLAEELYAPFRRDGTLLCYFRHRTSQDPFERLGQQDMTAHVNFTGLITQGEEAGLRFTGLVPQYRFLIGLGLLGEVESWEREIPELESLRLRLSLKHLLMPEAGMGEVFKVLIQHKGIENPRLDGLRNLESISLTLASPP
jgi:SAM-dependent MidA family methyltransferase